MADMAGLSEGLVWLDEHLLVLDKPAGLLAVPGRGEDKQDCLSARARAFWPDALVVHRLDMATSGLFAMARGLAAQRALARAFEHQAVQKRYVAVVAGRPAGESGTIDLPLAADWPNRPRQRVHAAGKRSVTHWRILAAEPGGAATRLELVPVTGRTHQLRVHLLASGHPILGDALYAPPEVAAQAPRLLLHACGLVLPHPAGGDRLAFDSPPPF